MLMTTIRRTALTTILAAGVASGAIAQTTGTEPRQPGTTTTQAAPSQSQDAQSAQPGMMRPGMGGMPGQGTMGQGMMGQGMMGQGMMGQGRMGQGMMGGMPMMRARGHMMKVMFAIADTDADGALSFEEVTAIHKRIFTRVDANKDGKVTIEEVQTFMRE